MTLPGDSSFPAEYKEKLDECDSVGPVLRNLVEKNILPRDIMTRAAFENAMVRTTYTVWMHGPSHSTTPTILTIGIDDDPRRFYERRTASYRYRTFCRNQPHNRRFPISIGPRSIHRGSQTEREVRYGRRVQDWRNPWFVAFLASFFRKIPFISAVNCVPFARTISSTFPHLFPLFQNGRLFSPWSFHHFILDPFH